MVPFLIYSWWRHQMGTFSALLAICAGNSPVPVNSPQRPVTRSFDVFFDLCLNKRLSKQSRGWWFETQSYPLWRQYNVWRKVLMCCINIFFYLFPDARDYFLSTKLLDLNLDLLTTSSVDISINESALSILAIWRNKRHGIKWWWNYPNFGGWGQAM